jgi:hypothetical protein
MSEEKVESIDINEPVEEASEESNQPTVEEASEVLDKKELKMAEESGLLKTDEETKTVEEEDKEKTVDPTDQEETEVLPTFDEVEKDEKLLGKYSKPDQAFYHRWKKDKIKRQEAQSETKEALTEKNISVIQAKEYKAKLNEVDSLLEKIKAGDDTITAEKIQEVIAEAKVMEDKLGIKEEAPLTPSSLHEYEKERAEKLNEHKEIIATKVKSTELVGRSKYNNFDELSVLAEKALELDPTGLYRQQFTNAFNDPSVSEDDIVEMVVTVAKTNPDFQGTTSGTQTATETNAKPKTVTKPRKQQSSASVTGGGGRRSVAIDDLTAEDLVALPQEEFEKVPQRVRDKILQKL